MTKEESKELWEAWQLLHAAGCEPEWPAELEDGQNCESVAREYVAEELGAAHVLLQRYRLKAQWPALAGDQNKVYAQGPHM